MVEVKLKRKIEYKNNHKREFVDPNKIFKALEYLRASGHPGYKGFDTREAYINRCREEDEIGYQSMFGQDYHVDEVFERLDPLDTAGADDIVTDEVNEIETEVLDDYY